MFSNIITKIDKIQIFGRKFPTLKIEIFFCKEKCNKNVLKINSFTKILKCFRNKLKKSEGRKSFLKICYELLIKSRIC